MAELLNYFANKFMSALFFLLCLSLLIIVVQKNPVYAVFSFIFTALLVFLFLLLIGAEFFALLILIIYTGVITVLFLFVVIMYNLRQIQLYVRNVILNPIFAIVSLKLYWFQKMFVNGYFDIISHFIRAEDRLNSWTLDVVHLTDLFNTHYFLFFMCGLLLFIAILGSIVITYPFFKYQK